MRKKRVMITVDADKWEMIQKSLKDKGYPLGSMSYYLNRCLGQLGTYLRGEGLDDHMSLFELEAMRVGEEDAALSQGWDILVDERKEDEGKKL